MNRTTSPQPGRAGDAPTGNRRRPVRPRWSAFLLSCLAAGWGIPVAFAQPTTDFGDAPPPYPTLNQNNGASHTLQAGFFLGALVDGELDGQPNANATGDDLPNPLTGGPDDEDGVTFTSTLRPGQPASLQIVASTTGRLDAWIDFNRDGDWTDPGEQIYTARLLNPGTNSLTLEVPTGASTGSTFGRFRFSSNGGHSFVGAAREGEVEDHQLTISPFLDFGDAPDLNYRTLLANGGARHVVVPGYHLGNLIDSEPDGQPNSNASGDDANPPGAGDDEDGVAFATPLRAGQSAQIRVSATEDGILNAWIDFNADGDWADQGEQILAETDLVAGDNSLGFTVPENATSGLTFARFRFNSQGKLGPSGLATDGEVEDYQVFIESAPTPEPCDRSSAGRDFWLTFPGNFAPDPDDKIQLSLFIAGPRSTSGNVSIPGLGFSQNFVIPPSLVAVVLLPSTADLSNDVDVVTYKGIHVTASDDVSVYALNHVRYTTDAFTCLPTAAQGTEHILLAYGNVHSNAPALNGSQFAVVAPQDNTTLTITLPVSTGGRQAGVPYQILLNQGQTYQFRDAEDAPSDLTGTFILSDKPVGIFSGHQCANIASPSTFFCDQIVEQSLPVTAGGTNFVAMPLATRSQDSFRILALYDDTSILVNGALLTANLDQGRFREILRAGPSHIAANKPVLVAQFSNSADHDNVYLSDPFMVMLPPTRMFLPAYTFYAPTNDFPNHYVNLLIPTAAAGSLSIDGVGIPAASFTPIAGSGFSGVQLPVTAGPHRVISSGFAAIPFGLVAYGFAEFDSYGYPGGFLLGDTTPPTVICRDTNLTISVGLGTVPNCFTTVPDLTDTVAVVDNCQLPPRVVVTQNPPPGTVVGPGIYIVVLEARDTAGNTGRCEVVLEVLDQTMPAIQCPPDIFVECQDWEKGAVVFFAPAATSLCDSNLQVVCIPPSGSVFPPGTTTVLCTATTTSGQAAECVFQVTVRCLDIRQDDAQPGLIITWSAGGVLETSSTVPGQWTPVRDATSPYRLSVGRTAPQQAFFRVRY